MLLLLAVGCRAGNRPAPASTGSAHPSAPATSAAALTPKREVRFKTADGQLLDGDLYLAEDHSAPAVVLIHHYGGDRSEFAPLVDLLRRADKRYTVLAFDCRGAGDVPPALHPGKLDAGELGSQDLRAAIHEVIRQTGGHARGVVLVGSSFGAALASKVAFDEPKVMALALISPGAAIQNVDIYHPYAQVRNLPTFLAGAADDNVSRMPLQYLSRMAIAGTVKRYPGSVHWPKLIGDAHPELWKDLESFLMRVFKDKPEPRHSLYYAPGKQPGAKKGKHPGVKPRAANEGVVRLKLPGGASR